jgi:hypothetical protein
MLLRINGMGHDLPWQLFDLFVSTLRSNASRAQNAYIKCYPDNGTVTSDRRYSGIGGKSDPGRLASRQACRLAATVSAPFA